MTKAYKDTLKETLKQEGKLVSSNKRPYVIINDITAYIDKNFTETLKLSTLADKFEVSSSYLSHHFKAHTGLSISRYIRLKRLGLAKKYYESGLPLTEAAMNAGFADYSVFYKAYRNEFGTSPTKDFAKPNND